MKDKILVDIARKVVWFQKPEETLNDMYKFLSYLMAYGFDDDVDIVMNYYVLEDFREAIRHAPAGIFDDKSWIFWHHALGFKSIPSLPRREIFTEEELKGIPKWRAKVGS